MSTRESTIVSVVVLLIVCVFLLTQNMQTTAMFAQVLESARTETMLSISSSNNDEKTSFAIVYLMAGCDDSTSSSCLGYLLNVLVAKMILDDHNYTSDVLVMICMKANHTFLPQDEWLHRAGVKVQYLAPIVHDNFALAQLDKFRVLTLLQYDRVLYMDADAIPLCNLEYLVRDENATAILSDYVAMGQQASPATGSIFLVTPKHGEFERLMALVRSRTLANAFDVVHGWVM